MAPADDATASARSEATDLLASIFCLPHATASSLHSESQANALCDLVERFARSIQPGTAGNGSCVCAGLSVDDLSALGAAAAALNSKHVALLPEYGCALLALGSLGGDVRLQPEEVALQLVGLDEWAFRPHSYPGGVQHTAAPGGHITLYCGTIDLGQWGVLLSRAHGFAGVWQKRRAAAIKGFQRTVAFMHAVVLDARESLAADTTGGFPRRMPRGGFTDVGPHTGGDVVRDTCWPLVKAVLQVILESGGVCRSPQQQQQPQLLFRRALAQLDLWLLSGQLQLLQPALATPTMLTVAWQMLRSASLKAAALADEGYDMSAFEAACRSLEERLQNTTCRRAVLAGRALELPTAYGFPALLGTVVPPAGMLPAAFQPRAEDGGLQAARLRAGHSLGSLPLLLRARAVRPGRLGLDQPANQLGLDDVAALEAAVDAYRALLLRFMGTEASGAMMAAEQRSRELLVVWVAYCLMHAAAGREHSIVLRYGVMGPYDSLRHLVLSDKAAVDAALSVAAYLQHCSMPGRQLFSLLDGGASTMALALEFAQACPRLQDIWAAERWDAEQRITGHWAEVQRKQWLAADLRQQLSSLESNGTDLKEELRLHTVAAYNPGPYGSYQRPPAQSNIDKQYIKKSKADIARNSAEQQRVKRELAEAEKAPPPVMQPLPSDSKLACQWLFFLFMPPLFRCLSRASFLAQQMLLPRPCSAEVAKAVAEEFSTSLVAHHNKQRVVRMYHPRPRHQSDGTDGAVRLWSSARLPDAKDTGPKHVDSCTSPWHGVWYPDLVLPSMAWSGSGSVADQGLWGQGFPSPFFNPFAPVDERAVELYFTEQLPQHAALLQWTMHQRGTTAATPLGRGNIGIAQQDSRPGCLSKPAYLAFCGLRSYPLGQLRRLCATLHDRVLPLSEPIVQVLVRQLLYHIGSLAGSTPPALLWRTGWADAGDVLETLCFELAALADELESTPREAVLLLGEVAAYLSDWHPPCCAVARRFAAMTSCIADGVEAQLGAAAAGGDSGLVAQLQAKQCRWRAMALLCYGAGPLGVEDVGAMLQLAVLLNHGRVFQEDVMLHAQLEALHVRAHNVMAARIEDVLSAVAQRPGILTDAIKRVQLDRTPDTLPWAQLTEAAGPQRRSLASFEAVGPKDGRLYSINLLDGTVLFDGWPPSRLPKDITQHRLFQRTFGCCTFEVTCTGVGVMQALRPMYGRLYDFQLSADGQQLTIIEVDKEHGVQLELLDGGSDYACGKWGAELPVRLRELHSHWLNRERGVIVIRPPGFASHDVHFLLQRVAATGQAASAKYDVRRVPPHLRARHWTRLLSQHFDQLTDRMVLLRGSSMLETFLAKYEQVPYIHTYDISDGDGGTLFELPRYGLEFVLRGGQVLSRNYSGYRLRSRQQLVGGEPLGGSTTGGGCGVSYTLPDFQQYLVLERVQGPAGYVPGARRADVLVLVPAGEVVVDRALSSSGGGVDASGLVRIDISTESGKPLKAHCYEVHGRFGHLRAGSVLARLQLAALYAATSTPLPEPLSRCTGSQTALQLLRQCWGNRPLTGEELAQLRSIGALGGHLAAGLRVLAHELEASACQLSHLHAPTTSAAATPTTVELDPDAAIAYEQETRSGHTSGGWGPNPRLQLTRVEEERTFGLSRGVSPLPAGLRRALYSPVELRWADPFPVAASFVAEAEERLSGLVVLVQSTAAPPYPLGGQQPGAGSGLERAMHAELAASWEAHHLHPSAEQHGVAPGAEECILSLQVRSPPGAVRHCTGDTVGPHGTSFRLLRLSGAAPSVGPLDLVRCAWQPQLLRAFNSFLSEEACAELHRGVLTWLELCVLEDRLGRLQLLAAAGDDYRPLLVQELLVRREWDVAEHPQWLVFEAEGQLQIRPAQYAVAKQLMGDPGAIAQLNMGEGKTRVILPKLVLHWANGTHLVRLNFLSTLLDEAYGHLHNHLCASVLGRKLFALPFNREVRITAAGVGAMRACLAYCHQEGGLLLAAPEHRLSLQLKWHELRAEGGAAAQVCAVLEAVARLPYLDLLDESDELLHHRYQLIYACGAPVALPALQERARGAQALLRTLSQLAARGALPLPPEAWVLEPAPGRPPGAFCGLRLLPGESLTSGMAELRELLARRLVEEPPYEFRWLKRHPLKWTIAPYQKPASAEGPRPLRASSPHALTADQLGLVLALRGLLAWNVLQQCLQKRHRVDFGVSRRPAARKRMAVPFRAAHTPSERSEYAQPDVALVLSLLAYYGDGLTRPQFRAALDELMKMGPNAQRSYYKEWLELSRAAMSEEHLLALDSVIKLDPTNTQQLKLLRRYFSHNQAVVNFWLNFCVFPSETRQFPQRLAELAEPSLRGTNGKMLDVMQAHTLAVSTLEQAAADKPVWQLLLDLAVGQGLDALLDCGALLAGASNSEAAQYLLPRLDRARFKGVCFCDESARSWVVCDVYGRQLPRHSSPIAEREAFVIFDDARCRGADLQLRREAVGLLTLGPGLCKDKLMQAAGRLRLLGRGQRLHIAATADIAAKVAAHGGGAAAPAVLPVLRWVMHNTVHATPQGVQAWAAQGLHFAAAKGMPERAAQDELLALQDLYGSSRTPEPVGRVVAFKADKLRAACAARGGPLAADMQALVRQVVDRSGVYGDGHEVRAGGGGADEECERELEEEEEEEQEVERQVPRVQPAAEQDWDDATALAARSPSQLDPAARVVPLPAVAQRLEPGTLADIGWSPRFCTSNFAHATAGLQPGTALNEYLRAVDALLLFPGSGELLLLSEREADQLLGRIWAARGGDGGGGSPAATDPAPLLVSLCYARLALSTGAAPLLQQVTYCPLLQAIDGDGQAPAPAALSGFRQWLSPLLCVQLFNGEASYGCAEQRRELDHLMARRLGDAEALVAMRGKQPNLPRSDLEQACREGRGGGGVRPSETCATLRQSPQHLATSASPLADNDRGQRVGSSGTNGKMLLLPLLLDVGSQFIPLWARLWARSLMRQGCLADSLPSRSQ
ncbi:hypothetical protein TSOC_000243 [Tetrabaena socialis]|uniref:ubiquitinyl hydrolase 1 n=1 Tax=Tetrabaena socialis TaxID=47790 RepID=A0A2J8AJS2_9CHLO|nr:hypothetical protein TSOC_000243 [Tetrabaena socialis]|eukprot:PNH12759.1 hypothetical protein TSOC_000243 [Tetrabaena socialis]